MADRRTASFSCVFITSLLAVALLSDLLSAGPIDQKLKGDVGERIQEQSAAAAAHRRLVRHRRNISWYQQNSDFWNWYKYFTDNGNLEAVQELDKIYLAYLQNKNRAEGRRSYKAYLRHLGEIYKSCADSADPNCVASATSRPTPSPPPPPPTPPPVKTCDPTKDAYCLYAALLQGKSPYLPLVLPAAPVKKAPPPAALKGPAPAKAPAPLYVRTAVPVKDPQSGYYYYAPSSQSFLTKEQKAELLRICQSDDVECLQYHLRAAYGHKPSQGPLPSYAHLGCDPQKDPQGCKPRLVQKAPSGMYLQYPDCDPMRDPRCAHAASLVANRAPSPPAPAGPGSCNPLFQDGCNPLTATRFSSTQQHYQDDPRDQAAAIRAAPSPPPEEQQDNDPYAMLRDAYNQAQRVNDPYARYRQAPPSQANQYAMYRQAPPPAASDPYARYRQAPPPSPANDQLAMLRHYMAQAQGSDPYAPRMGPPAPAPQAPQADPSDPFAMFREAAAAMHRRGGPPPQAPPPAPRQQHPFFREEEEPAQEEPQQHHPLGPPGKTKEGYDCYIGYDRDCSPVKPAAGSTRPRSAAHRGQAYPAEAYEPHVNADGSRSGVLEPDNPHCDPEYDRDCRLRRYEPEAAPQPPRAADSQQHEEEEEETDASETEPFQSGHQEEPYLPYPAHLGQQGMPSFQDLLRGYGDQFPEQDDHRAYADDYRKK